MFLSEVPKETLPIPDLRNFFGLDKKYGINGFSVNLLDAVFKGQERQGWYNAYKTHEEIDQLLEYPEAKEVDIYILENFKISGSRNQALKKLANLIAQQDIVVTAGRYYRSDQSTSQRKNEINYLNPEEFTGFSLANPLSPLIFLNLNSPDPLRSLIQLLYQVISQKTGIIDTHPTRVSEETKELEEELLRNLTPETRTLNIPEISKNFIMSVGYSTMGGDTFYRDAYSLLDKPRHNDFVKLLRKNGVDHRLED